MCYLLQTRGLVFQEMIPYNDIKIPKAVTTFITGESGSGKSTLLRFFNGTLSPSAGEVFYQGINLETLETVALRQEVSLVSQEVFLFDSSILENFKQFYCFRNLPTPSKEEIEQLLKLCCLELPLESHAVTMSGGERQRLYLAVFLSFVPKVLLLDEPTSSLDAKTAMQVMANITAFCKEHQTTLIVVSHDAQITHKFSENTICLQRQVL